jgi:transposase InsO family protein
LLPHFVHLFWSGLRRIKNAVAKNTPQTNGKAERFIQTALREWAYAPAFEHSERRYAALPAWLHRYNWHRPHVIRTQATDQPTRFDRG